MKNLKIGDLGTEALSATSSEIVGSEHETPGSMSDDTNSALIDGLRPDVTAAESFPGVS